MAQANKLTSTVRVRPSSCQPTKAQLEEHVSILGAKPEEVARAHSRLVTVEWAAVAI